MTFSIRLGLQTIASGAVLLAFSTSSFAQSTCETDSDCAQGLVCEVTGGSACTSAACAPGTDCIDIPQPECEPVTYSTCVPGPCTSDAECGPGLVCHTEVYTECSGGGSKPPSTEPGAGTAAGSGGSSSGASGNAGPDVPSAGDAGAPTSSEPLPDPDAVDPGLVAPRDAGAAPDCKQVEVASCVPKWTLPCQAAADCGDGFECVPNEICSCSGSTEPSTGSGGSSATPPPAPGGAAARPAPGATPSGSPELAAPEEDRIPPDTTCLCEPTDEAYCQAKKVKCVTADDCPDEWTCLLDSTVTPSVPPAPPGTSTPAPAADAGTSFKLLAPVPTGGTSNPAPDGEALVPGVGICQPPNVGISTPPRGGSVGENGGEPTATPKPQPGTTPTVPDAPPKDDGSDPTTGGGGAEIPVTPAPGAVSAAPTSTPKPSATETSNEGSHNAAVDDDVDEGKEGCSISQTGRTHSAPTSAGWVLAAGFAAFFARRRNPRG